VTPRPPALLWQAPAFLPQVQPALTATAVRDAERSLGVTLPPAYLSMLAVQNGGYPRARWPDLPHRSLDGIGPRYPSLTVDDAWWRTPDPDDGMWVPPGSALLIPFDGEGHWNLCLDYRARGPRAEPAVTFATPETALRLPTDPGCRLIVECTPDATGTTRALLRATGHCDG
jgi:hypothetical protein